MKNKELVEELIKKGYKITCAESCTGGLLASSIVDVAGSSKVIDMSFVTYANSAKIELLGVLEETINKYGVVSEDVAKQMAKGCALKAKANVGVGISGIAGPTGDTPSKPIGMVCFGFYINGNIYSYTSQFGNIGRTNVRCESVKFVIDTLLELLKKN